MLVVAIGSCTNQVYFHMLVQAFEDDEVPQDDPTFNVMPAGASNKLPALVARRPQQQVILHCSAKIPQQQQ